MSGKNLNHFRDEYIPSKVVGQRYRGFTLLRTKGGFFCCYELKLLGYKTRAGLTGAIERKIFGKLKPRKLIFK